jgi:hypothetical protein
LIPLKREKEREEEEREEEVEVKKKTNREEIKTHRAKPQLSLVLSTNLSLLSRLDRDPLSLFLSRHALHTAAASMQPRSVSSSSAASRRGGAAAAAAAAALRRAAADCPSLPLASAAMPLPRRRPSVAAPASSSSAQQAPPVALPIDYSQVRNGEIGSR